MGLLAISLTGFGACESEEQVQPQGMHLLGDLDCGDDDDLPGDDGVGDDGAADDGTGDDLPSDDTPAGDDGSCMLAFDTGDLGHFTVEPYGFVDLKWSTIGSGAPEVYLGVIGSDGSLAFDALVSNDGYYLWIPPATAQPGDQFEVFIESADTWIINGLCFASSWVEVVEPPDSADTPPADEPPADEPPADQPPADAGYCDLFFMADIGMFMAEPGGSVEFLWQTAGTAAPDVFLGITNDAGITWELDIMLVNSGWFEWTLPDSMEPGLYEVQLLSAEMAILNNACLATSWLEVLEPGSGPPADAPADSPADLPGDDLPPDPTGYGQCTVDVWGDQFAVVPGGALQVQASISTPDGVWVPELFIALYGGTADGGVLYEAVVPNEGIHWIDVPADIDTTMGYAVYIESVITGPDSPMCSTWIQIEIQEPAAAGDDGWEDPNDPPAADAPADAPADDPAGDLYGSCWFQWFGASSGLPGETVELEWDYQAMDADANNEVMIFLFSGWEPADHVVQVIVPNTGRFDLELPADLDPDAEFHVYIESVVGNPDQAVCWEYMPFDVLEPA